ncbi:MAG: DUF1854 domain-containing protein [Fimbriimonadaceae bacterium]|nr:DUF1854 domain-containing protein [Fimbriimonadaceae bacterium]
MTPPDDLPTLTELPAESGTELDLSATEVVFLDPAELTFERTPGGVLRLHQADRSHLRVAVVRVLPLSQPEGYLSIRNGDREVGILRQLEAIEPAQREMLRAELDRRYFRPLIEQVTKLQDVSGTFRWQVVTDRGSLEFSSTHPRQSCVAVTESRWAISDTDGNRYEIRDLGALDRRSRALLIPFLA